MLFDEAKKLDLDTTKGKTTFERAKAQHNKAHRKLALIEVIQYCFNNLIDNNKDDDDNDANGFQFICVGLHRPVELLTGNYIMIVFRYSSIRISIMLIGFDCFFCRTTRLNRNGGFAMR